MHHVQRKRTSRRVSSIYDSVRTFVETSYEQLLASKTVAIAVQEAREKARVSGDPTWIGYVVYAHPGAALVRN